MNKIYKIVWNRARNCYMVASELAKSNAKSASSSKKKAAALLAAAVLSAGMAGETFAAGSNITYDDNTKASITLGVVGSDGTFTTNTTIQGVKGGNIFENSNYVATGGDVYTLSKKVDSYNSTINKMNTTISTINSTMAEHTTQIAEVDALSKSNQTKLNRGYVAQINGIDVRTVNPNDNNLNFKSGSHVSITNDNGSLKFAVNDNGKVASGDTQYVTGGTVYTSVKAETDARAAADTAINNKIGTMTKDGSYITAQGTISANLTALDTQTKKNTDAIASETAARTKAISDEVTARNAAIKTETDARTAADTAINNKIGTIAKDGSYVTAAGSIASNLTALDTQTKANTTAIANEVTARDNAVKAEASARSTAVSNEAKARQDADNAINSKIGTMTKDGSYVTAQGTLSANLTALDTQAKANATAIANEVTARTKAVSDEAAARQTAVSNEAKARQDADTAINNKIGTIAKDGSYIAANGTIASNLTTLDTQTKTNADAIAKEVKDRTQAISDEVTARNAAIQKETDARTASEAAINSKIGTLASGGNYLGKNDSVADNLLKLDTQAKANADAITKEATDRANAITTAKNELSAKISTLDGNAVKYDDDTKATITMAAKDGTTITNVKAGALSATSKDAVNGSQLFETNTKLTQEIADRDAAVKAEAKARTDAMNAEIKARGDADTAIKNTIGTLAGGSYIAANGTIASNLSALDTKLKSTADSLETEITARKADVADLESKIGKSLTSLSDNAVQYDSDKKASVTLGGVGGTTLTNVKAGNLAANSTDAVNGAQLFDTNTKLAQEVTDRTNALQAEATARAEAVKGIQDTIGTLGKDGSYITMKGTIADNLSALDTKVKANEDALTKEAQARTDAINAAKQEITNTVSNLDTNAVKYSNTAKSSIELDGKGGTTISNLKDATLSESSTEAVSGKQLFATNTKLAQEIADRTQAIADEVTARNNAIQKEADARAAADTAINEKIGTISAAGSYIGKNDSIADNLTKLDAQAKKNADDITKEATARNEAISAMKDQITGSIDSLTDNAVKYKDGTNKGVVELGGLDGTKITRLADGTLSETSTDAVTGKQLFSTNTKLAQEVTDRTNAIAKEVEDRNAAIAKETEARTDAINDLKNNVIGTVADGTTVKAGGTIADNLGKLDTATKANADAIKAEETARKTANTELQNKLDTKLSSLSDNSVQYTDADKGTVKLGGANGTTISNVKAGLLDEASTEAVNGSQLYATNTAVSRNAISINNLRSSINSLNSNIEVNRENISNLQDSITTINTNVAKATSNLTKMITTTANTSLSNINDDGRAVITDVAKTAVQNYLKANLGADTQSISDEHGIATFAAKSPVATYAAGSAITYDSDDKKQITLGNAGADGTFTTKTAIVGVQGGNVYEGSTYAATGDDVYQISKRVGTYDSTINKMNTTISTINATMAEHTTQIAEMDATSKSNATKVNRGYDIAINGVTVKSVNPNNNVINFKNGDNVTLSDSDGSLAVSVKANGVIADGNTGLVSGGTAKVALDKKADTDLSNLTDKAKQNIKDVVGGDMSGKADLSLGNISEAGVAKIKSVMSSDMANKANADLSNISTDGLNKIKDLSKGSVKVVDGNGTKVSTTYDKDGNISYAVSINAGDITKGDTGFVTAATVKKSLDTKANVDLDNLSATGLAKIKSTMSTDLATKAGTDASNIDAGKYAEKLGTGVVTDGDNNLVTGSTVYNAIKNIEGGQGGLITKVDVDLKNISNEGKTNIKNISQEAVKVADGKYTSTTSEKDEAGNLTYKVNVIADGAIEDGNTGLITGATAKKALDQKANLDLANISDAGKNVIKDTMKADLDTKANKDLSNLSEEAKNQIKNTMSVDLSTKADITGANVGKYATEWAKALGTGKIEKGSVNLVTGDQVYTAVSVKADKSYVDTELGKKANISDVNTALDGKANADLSNISDAGKNVIKDTMKADLDQKANKADVDKALAGKVDTKDFNTVKADVDQAKKDLANKADKSYVDDALSKKADADNVYTKEETDKKIDSKIDTKIESVKNTITGDLENKVDKDGTNIDKEKWQEKLGDGKNEAGDKGLISGDTLNKAIEDVRKDGVGLVKQEEDTIKVAPKSDATKVDFKGTDKDGNSIDRVLTGIKTDEDDVTSAANVGYVQGIQSNLESQMDAMNTRLSDDIKEAGAVASALAGLHHIDYDPDNKLDFAVATAGYRGKSAAALGAFYQPNENIMFSLAGTLGNKHNAWNMGLSFKIGQGGDSAVLSRRVLTNQVKALTAANQEKEQRVEQLEQDVQDLQNKLNLLLKSATLSENVEKSIAK